MNETKILEHVALMTRLNEQGVRAETTKQTRKALADQIGKALLMDAKTDAGFLPSIELADYLPEGVTIDANPEAKA